MPDRTPHTEMCSCSSTTVVRVHSSGSYCGDAQHERLADALREMRTLATDADADVEAAASDFLDALRKEPAPVADDITLLNQAQASIYRALCDARQAPPVWWSPTHGLIEVAHKVSPDDERLVRVADRRVIELPGDAIELRPVDAPPVPMPAPVVRSDVIERAAQVFCDSSRNGQRWVDLSEPFRDLYRRRVRALAEAGLLAVPAEQPAAEPEPYHLVDEVGDYGSVESWPGTEVLLRACSGLLMTPDQADQLADALRAHAAARRAEGGGS